jgi:hypothetical protein
MEAKKQRLYRPAFALVYAAILPRLQEIAREHGYALAAHGSMCTDFDLVACPWVEDASDPETLIKAICEFMGTMYEAENFQVEEQKPHGRRAWSLHFDSRKHGLGCGGPYLDISVMPRLQDAQALAAEKLSP